MLQVARISIVCTMRMENVLRVSRVNVMKLMKRSGSSMHNQKPKQQFHKLVCYNTGEALQTVNMLVRHLDSVGVKVVDEKWSIRFRITTVKLITERHNED